MIRWVEQNRLGTGAFDSVVAECARNGMEVLDVRALVDKPGNDVAVVRDLLMAGHATLLSGAPLVVACDFGESRSNAIAAGLISLWRKIPFDEAIQEVVTATGETSIKLGVVEAVRAALGVNDDSNQSEGATLVTGGSGFLGSHLIKLLCNTSDLPHKVVVPSRRDVDLTATLSLAQYCRSHDVRRIVHLAAPRVYTNIRAMGESIALLRSVAEVCISLNLTLLHVSGSVVFSGYDTELLQADFELPGRPKHIYGETKFLEEQLLNTLVTCFGLRVARVRLAPVYGPGGERPRFINKFTEDIINGVPIRTHRFRNGPARLELLYIDDAAAALRQILARHAGGCFHIGTGVAVTPADVARYIAEIVGKPLALEEIAIDEPVANVVLGVAADGPGFQWVPTVALREGLRRTIASRIEGMRR